MKRFVFFILLIFVWIPASFAYRKKREDYRSASNNYRVHRSADTSYWYRIQADLPKYRVQRSVGDSYRYRYRIEGYRAAPEFFVADSANQSNDWDIPQNGLNCTITEQTTIISAANELFINFNVSIIVQNRLPKIENVWDKIFNGSYKDNQKFYQNFNDKVKNVPEYCFYQSSIVNMVIVDNSTKIEAEEYVELFGLLPIYYKSENEQKSFVCLQNAGMICYPDMKYSTCSQYKELVECDVSIYTKHKCPSDFTAEFCHFLANDLRREEVIDQACVKEIHATCNGTNTNTAAKNFSILFFVLPFFIRIFYFFSKF